ncbi:hypothetical protein M3Y97_00093000 [Aphelenchoides bicaudatus]|nr:hypothetical protein M3Y97_00093000 [Aphelenchoides bicaudatus]
MYNQQNYGMPPGQQQMHPQDQQQGNFMNQPMNQQQFGNMPAQNQQRMHPQMNQNYQHHYMNTPQGPDSQPPMAQPSPYAPSPYNQQHSVSSYNAPPPGSVNSMQQPHTPQSSQQQLNIPQRSADGRFASPQSITQRSPVANVSNQPMSQNPSVYQPVQTPNQPTPGQPTPGSQQKPTQQNPPQPFPTDPLQANKVLILKELRRAIREVSQNASYLLSLKFSTETRNPPSVPNYQALSVGNPASANPGSNNPTPQKPSEEDIQTARERYLQAVQQFLAVTDNIERNYATIIQANREFNRFDALALPNVKVPSDLSIHPYIDMIQSSLDIISEDNAAVDRAINDMNRIFNKIKEVESNNQKMDMM